MTDRKVELDLKRSRVTTGPFACGQLGCQPKDLREVFATSKEKGCWLCQTDFSLPVVSCKRHFPPDPEKKKSEIKQVSKGQ